MFLIGYFNVQTIIPLTPSVPRRLHMRCTHSNTRGLTFYTTCGKHLYDDISSLRGDVWAHIIILAPPHQIKVAKKCSCTNLFFLSSVSLSSS